MEGKICVVTGSNSGIGKETARALAAKGATVYMVCRSKERGNAAKEEIIQSTGNTNVHLRLVDLSSFASIKEYGTALREELPRIDILINNAGAMFGEYKESVDGFEMTFALNHLGYFLNTHYLLGLVRKGSDKRIINVSSSAHRMPKSVDFDNLNFKEDYEQFKAYCQSKLFNIHFTKYLAEQVQSEGITVNCLHPGVVATNFGESGGKLLRFLIPIARPFMISSATGAETSIYLATSPDVAGKTGDYYKKKKIAPITDLAKDKEVAAQLWDTTLRLTGIKDYGNP